MARQINVESKDGQIGYSIIPKRGGRYYIEASLIGGAEHKLPFQDFESVEAARAWIAEYERKREEREARYVKEEPIYF